MNKKAIVSTFVTDIYSFLVFSLLVIGFLVLFKTSSTPVIFEITGSQISSGTESWISNYFRTPVQVDINDDNVKESLTNAEVISWYANTHEEEVLTTEEQIKKAGEAAAGMVEPEQNYIVPPCSYGEMIVYKPDSDKIALSMMSRSLAYKKAMEWNAMDTFKRKINYELYIPSETNGKLSKVKILVTCYE